jgi:hypothetical protein
MVCIRWTVWLFDGTNHFPGYLLHHSIESGEAPKGFSLYGFIVFFIFYNYYMLNIWQYIHFDGFASLKILYTVNTLCLATKTIVGIGYSAAISHDYANAHRRPFKLLRRIRHAHGLSLHCSECCNWLPAQVFLRRWRINKIHHYSGFVQTIIKGS